MAQQWLGWVILLKQAPHKKSLSVWNCPTQQLLTCPSHYALHIIHYELQTMQYALCKIKIHIFASTQLLIHFSILYPSFSPLNEGQEIHDIKYTRWSLENVTFLPEPSSTSLIFRCHSQLWSLEGRKVIDFLHNLTSSKDIFQCHFSFCYNDVSP